ncbi:hypothetical protein K3495_g13194 [Podosphaera aphanis]|nr:hypothetical protein K3495_g13194 [Podosphaera aphanis]
MWALLRLLIVTLLCYVALSLASLETIEIRSEPDGGYRCNNMVFRQDVLSVTYEEATRKLTANIQNAEAYLKTSEVYPEGAFGGFGGEDISPLWPLPDPIDRFSPSSSNQALQATPGHLGEQRPNYFLVLGPDLSFIGVVKRNFQSTFAKCVWEPDLSTMLKHPFVSSYLCPSSLHPVETIESIIHWNFMTISAGILIPFDGSLIFGVSDPLYSRPIQADGKPNGKSTQISYLPCFTFIVVDKHMSFIGFVFKKWEDTYLRCKPLSQNTFTPRFLHTNLIPEPLQLKPGDIDVFKCGENFLRSGLLLQAVPEAIAAFKIKRCSTHKRFPALFSGVIKGDQDSSVYLWPASPDGSSVYHPTPTMPLKFASKYDFFILLNDFYDVLGVLQHVRKGKGRGKGKYEKCDRVGVQRTVFPQIFRGPQ